jgi:uroporphyrin-III C-methyltransferase/precorrin-2 dehydrogenase/sirohydrochlorin ferrochelatase
MEFFPVFFDLRDRPCLVVGGGEVAARKVMMLRRAQARVRIVAPELCPVLATRAQAGEVEHQARAFVETDVTDVALVIAATDDRKVNEQVSIAARTRNLPVNVVDCPELCTFISPSVIDRDPLIVAVSTGGASPVLARSLRARLESLIPASYGRLARLVDSYRAAVKQRFANSDQRRVFWEGVLSGPVPELVYAGRDADARVVLDAALAHAEMSTQTTGEVYLVGAGPGDPDLLTFRALRLMQQADVVVYDRLVSQPILDLVRRDAELIYAGKERAKHTIPQEEINDLLVRLAREGKRVLRLKGGDPFIFGRGGEEIETLAACGIPFQVVPGITAAAGCAAYAGIPLTHRDHAQSCVFVTGHLKDGSMDLNWDMLAQPRQTVVFYMGLQGVDVLCSELIRRGVSPQLPAALIQQGTTPQQRVFTGTLATLPGIVHGSEVRAPTLIIVGEVVRLRDKLAWFTPGEAREGGLIAAQRAPE